MRTFIMKHKKRNDRLVQLKNKLVIAWISSKLLHALIDLLNMAFNYTNNKYYCHASQL